MENMKKQNFVSIVGQKFRLMQLCVRLAGVRWRS